MPMPQHIAQQIAALEPLLQPRRLERMRQVLAQRTDRVVFAFERMVDPHNLSAVMRSLDAFAFQEVHLARQETQAALSHLISRGTDRWLSVQSHEDGPAMLAALKSRGYQVWASHLRQPGSVALADMDFSVPVALVFGNEHAGVEPETLALAHGVFHIPMRGMVESFNLSVAAALSAYHARLALDRLQAASPEPKSFYLSASQQQALYLTWLRQSVRRADTVLKQLVTEDG